MSTTEKTPLDQTGAPEKSDMYARYYQMSEANSKAGTEENGEISDEKLDVGENESEPLGEDIEGSAAPTAKTETPIDEKESEESRPEKKGLENNPEGQRTIDRLVRSNKRKLSKIEKLEAKIAELTGKIEDKTDFISQAEYLNHQVDQKSTKNKIEDLESQKIELEEEVKQDEQEHFQSTWADRVLKNFRSKEEIESFVARVQQNGNADLKPEIHSFIKDSEFGPKVLDVLLSRPDIAQRLNGLSSMRLNRELFMLEDAIVGRLQGTQSESSATQSPEKKTSNAPGPIGTIGTGTKSSGAVDSKTAVENYKRKHFGGR